MNFSLNHTAIICSTEDSVRFYERLGFSETGRVRRPHDTVVFMNGPCGLELFIDPSHPARLTVPEAKGLRHLAFDVDGFDEAVAVFGAEPVRTSFDGVRFTFIRDPDGQPIELRERSSSAPLPD